MVKGLTRKKLIWLITVLASVAIALILRGICVIAANRLTEQHIAKKWSPEGGYSQISMFFNQDTAIDIQTLQSLEHQITDNLAQESITVTSQNPSARLLTSCYFSEGQISLEAQYGKSQLSAYGVGGDFFDFHELKLISGDYFSKDDMNMDYCLLDELAAWKLFGSTDIDGQVVYMGDTPLIVKGVVDMPKGKLATAAGVKDCVCFIPYEFMDEHIGVSSITAYEIVMPSPVPGYASDKLSKNIGIAEENMFIVENTTRFSVIDLAKHFKTIGYSSIRTKAISFCWWENIARVYEDRLSILTIIYLVFAVYAVLTIIVLIVIFIIQNKDNFKAFVLRQFEKITDSIYKHRRGGKL